MLVYDAKFVRVAISVQAEVATLLKDGWLIVTQYYTPKSLFITLKHCRNGKMMKISSVNGGYNIEVQGGKSKFCPVV